MGHTPQLYLINGNFDIVNYPDLSSNIPEKSAYGVYISQLVRIGRICSNFIERIYKLTQKLIEHGFWGYVRHLYKKFARSHVSISLNMDIVYGNTLRKGYVYRPVMLFWAAIYVYLHSPCLTFLTLSL